MKASTTAILLAAAMGVSAHPSGHGHAHQHAHRSLEERGNFVMYQRPEVSSAEPTSTAAPPPPPPSSTAPPPPPPGTPSPSPAVMVEEDNSSSDDSGSSSGGSGQGVSTYTDFCAGAERKRATLDEIAYAGNVGTPDHYGCNLMLAQSNVAEEYKYSIKMENVDDNEQECVCFLKIGPTGGINGFWDGNEALKFSIPAGETQYVVADENTQGGCACGAGSVPLTPIGQFASTWLEFDVGNESNDYWSGADASCLVSAALGLDIPGLQVCGHDTCSTINPGGTGTNAFLGGMEALDGLGLNIPAGEVRLEVKVGFKGE